MGMGNRILLRKEAVYHARHRFFTDIVVAIDMAPTAADTVLGLAPFHVRPLAVGQINDPQQGTLLIPFRSDFHGREQQFMYLVRQIGHEVQVCLVLQEETQMAPLLDGTLPIDMLWPGTANRARTLGEATHYEWSFCEPDLLHEFQAQEKYVLGMRLFHFKVVLMIYNGLAPTSERRTADEPAEPRRFSSVA